MIPVRKDFSYPFPCYSDGVKKGEQEWILTQILLLELVYTHSLSYRIDSIINTERCFTLGLDSHDEKNSTGPYLLRTSTHTNTENNAVSVHGTVYATSHECGGISKCIKYFKWHV